MSRRPIVRQGWRPFGAVSQTVASPGFVSTTAAAAGLAGALNTVLEGRLRAAEERAAREGQEAGRTAGAEDPTARMDPDTVRGAAFNRGAIETGARRLETGLRTRLDELAREHAADPGTLQEKAQEYIAGVTTGLPADLRPVFDTAAETLLRPYVTQATREQERAVADERLASFAQASRERLAAISRNARNAPADAAAAAALAQDMGAMREDLVALGPRHAFTFRGVRYEADPTRAGAIGVQDMERQLAGVERETAEQAALGSYERGPRTAGWIDGWERRAREGGVPGLDQDGIDRVAARMRADAGRRAAEARAAQQEGRAVLAQRDTENAAAIAIGAAPPHAIADADLAAAGYDAAGIRTFREAERQRWFVQEAKALVRTAGPEELRAMAARFMPDGDLFAANPRSAVQVVEALRTRVDEIETQDLVRAALTGDAEGVARLAADARGMEPARARALAEAIEARERALAQAPADYAIAAFPRVELAWRGAGDDPVRTEAAIAATIEAQATLGVPPAARVAVPASVLAPLVRQTLAAESPTARGAAIMALLDRSPDERWRAPVRAALAEAGVPVEALAVLAPGAGVPAAERAAIIGALLTDPRELGRGLPEGDRKRVTDATIAAYRDSAIGRLRADQGRLTGEAGFTALQRTELRAASALALARADRANAATTGFFGGADPDTLAVRDLTGGLVALRDGERAVLAVPAATPEADRRALLAGLEALRQALMNQLIAGETNDAAKAAIRQQLTEAVWADAPGGAALYVRGTGAVLPGADGAPVRVTREEAMALGRPQADRPQRTPLETRELMERTDPRAKPRLPAQSSGQP
jgi:hypothetical protein